MITLLPLNRVIVSISICYASVISVVVWLVAEYSNTNDLSRNVKIALTGATGLSLLLLFMFQIGWKWLWSKFPKLNTLLFPNLDGKWAMRIYYTGTGATSGSGQVAAVAMIKQSFLGLSMEVESLGSSSKTLIAHPKKDPESGRPLIYYMYQVDPKAIGSGLTHSYTGSAILRYSTETSDSLAGNYYTSVGTHGHFVLNRVDN